MFYALVGSIGSFAVAQLLPAVTVRGRVGLGLGLGLGCGLGLGLGLG